MAKVCPNCELAYSDDDFFCAADGSALRSTAPEADNLVGTVIADRYRIEAMLGEGGMGRVYRARHVRVPRDAAIKVLRRTLISDAYAVAAFNREARNAASVGDHPNVAAVYDFGETPDGLVFLAMEFIEGETLGKRLDRESTLPPARAVDVVRQIASGLSVAHELPEPVVHRDLKPDNILLKATRDGSDWVKIVDFGIAKAVKRDTQLLTSPGLVVGTPRYMSPEQLTGATIDVRSDIYALGMIAFQMLTGRMPFRSASRDEESTIQWALQRLTMTPLTLRDVRPDVQWPEGAEQAIARALAGSADDRFPTAMEFARTLARSFGFTTPSRETGVVSSTPGPVSEAVDEAKRSTAPTALVGTPTVAPAPAPVPVARPAQPARTSVLAPEPPLAAATRAPAAAPPAAKRTSMWSIAVAGVVVTALGAGYLWQRGRDRGGVTPISEPPTRQVAQVTKPAARDTVVPVRPDSKVVALPKTERPPVQRDSARVARPDPKPVIAEPDRSAERIRAAFDRMKVVLQDPDAAAASGQAAQVVSDVTRLLPTLTSRADSVEATVYAIEANLALDRSDDACRLLTRIRPAARGTEFEGRVEFFASNADLGCATRR